MQTRISKTNHPRKSSWDQPQVGAGGLSRARYLQSIFYTGMSVSKHINEHNISNTVFVSCYFNQSKWWSPKLLTYVQVSSCWSRRDLKVTLVTQAQSLQPACWRLPFPDLHWLTKTFGYFFTSLYEIKVLIYKYIYFCVW